MSYTLRGRIESRLGAAALPFLAACVLAPLIHRWWPLALAGLMVAAGLALDLVYDRLIPYQPGWAAVPLGALELVVVMGLVYALDVMAPLPAALAFYGASWLVAQVLGHAVYPLLHLTYGDDGGELGRGGSVLVAAAPVALAALVGIAWTTQPPVVRLPAGVHEGPLVLDRPQRLVAAPGAVVRGGIRITADDVSVHGVTVDGGEHGIEVVDAERVVLDDVTVSGSSLDGISARRSTVAIHDCVVHSLRGPLAQGIDISFGMMEGMSEVEGCTVTGGYEGIVTHMAMVDVRRNRVSDTALRAITMTEMSVGEIERNEVRDALGVGIFCGDYSRCEIERNLVVATRADPAGSRTRAGYAIQAHYGASAELEGNRLVRNARGAAAFINSEIVH